MNDEQLLHKIETEMQELIKKTDKVLEEIDIMHKRIKSELTIIEPIQPIVSAMSIIKEQIKVHEKLDNILSLIKNLQSHPLITGPLYPNRPHEDLDPYRDRVTCEKGKN